VKLAESIRHWKNEPPENVKVGLGSLVRPEGPESMCGVAGTVVSTVKGRRAGVGSLFPAASVAVTSKLWKPSARGALVHGELQEAKLAASIRHWKVEGSLAEKVNVGVGSFVHTDGPESIVVSGGSVSTATSRPGVGGAPAP
jgi:hypothetical protein